MLTNVHTWIQNTTTRQIQPAHKGQNTRHSFSYLTLPLDSIDHNIIIMDVGKLHFTGDLVHIVGTNIDCRGRSCPEHAPRPCGSALRVDDWVVFRLIHLDDEGLDEDAIEARRMVQGTASCCVGFLQRSYVPHFERYHDKYAQIREIWSSADESATQRSMFHRNHECCVAGMMGPTLVHGVNDTSYDNNHSEEDDTDDESN